MTPSLASPSTVGVAKPGNLTFYNEVGGKPYEMPALSLIQ